MELINVIELLKAKVLTGSHNIIRVEKVFSCDLMSDVLALVEEDTVLMTGLVNIQTIRTAEMKDIKCIIFVRGKVPDETVVSLAEELNITLLSTELSMFNACGLLFSVGIKGVSL